MYKPAIAGALIALGFLGFQGQWGTQPYLELKEERMTIEYSATENQAALLVEAEAEVGLSELHVRDPRSVPIINLRGQDAQALGLQGFVIETRECTPEMLFATYPEGIYDLRARTVDGQPVLGSAVFSHELLAAPVVVYPFEGASNVPTKGLIVTWIPDTEAVGYRVVLEQDENDGLTVELSGGTSSLQVPDGFLAPGRRTQLEVAAIGISGNSTLVDVVFATR